MKRLGGWWRLWILLSVLWGIGAVVAVLADWPGPLEKQVLTPDQIKLLSPQSHKMLSDAQAYVEDEIRRALPALPSGAHLDSPKFIDAPGPTLQTIKKGDVVVTPPGKAPPWETAWRIEPSNETMPSGQEFLLNASTDELRAFKQDYSRVQGLVLRNARLKLVGFALFLWTAPCLLLLAFALGFRWVVRGFKKEPE
ncbi:hypothetical protein [Geothrix limicola]|uniref:hypothetical protein n=1 Tax=Geothrix limicola TaxID=2927978 RepID=UPI002555AF4A|nr:hypothetical protein [Geothrix limicola]